MTHDQRRLRREQRYRIGFLLALDSNPSVRPSFRLSSVTESLAHANCFLPGNRERFLLRETARPESDGRGRPSFPSPPVRQQQSR